MHAIIPAAGQGTRLYPQTHTKPKAMVRLAGRPILGHILSSLAETRIDRVAVVVGGPMQDQIVQYATGAYGDRFTFEFPVQMSVEGLGHSIYQARSAVGDDPVLIALGDMLFERGYQAFLQHHNEFDGVAGSIGTKTVSEPEHYGVVETDADGRVTQLFEKPDDPPSNQAISGVYIVEDTSALFDALDHLILEDIRGADGEYQLTDALQLMVERGAALRTFEVQDWYDCGRPQTLLEANKVLLAEAKASPQPPRDDSVVVPPVDVGEHVELASSVVGPYVSVDDGASIENSIIRNSILGREATLNGVNLEGSIVGDNSDVRGEANHLNIGDNSEISL